MPNDRLTPPDFTFDTENNPIPLPGKYCHNNHQGGFDGMNQKFWTLITIVNIKYTAHNLNLIVNVVGQGDNQVVFVKFTKDQMDHKVDLRQRFLINLKENFLRINLVLKNTDTWCSSKLFEYGKERVIEGAQISSGTKKATKLISDINDGISSFQSGLSTIETVTESIANKSPTPDVAFLLYSFETTNYLQRHNIIKKDTSIIQSSALLNYPNCMGGLTVATYFSHFIRGGDDKLTLCSYSIKNIIMKSSNKL